MLATVLTAAESTQGMTMMNRKYKHLPPENNYTHLSPYCRKPECVFGFIDWFDLDENYLTTTVCAVCKPDTYDLLQQFPNVGQRSEAQQRALAEKRENMKVGARRNDF